MKLVISHFFISGTISLVYESTITYTDIKCRCSKWLRKNDECDYSHNATVASMQIVSRRSSYKKNSVALFSPTAASQNLATRISLLLDFPSPPSLQIHRNTLIIHVNSTSQMLSYKLVKCYYLNHAKVTMQHEQRLLRMIF